MILRLFRQIFPQNQPDWFRGMNMLIVLPVLAWPFVVFMGIFMFDNPFQHHQKTFLRFIAVIAYPIYLGLIAYTNSRLFFKNKMLGALVTGAFALALLACAGYFGYMIVCNA